MAACSLTTWEFPRALSRSFSVTRRRTVIGKKGPRCVLSAMAQFAELPLEKKSINDLLQLTRLSSEERANLLHDALKIGLSRCAMVLMEMPFGFCNAPSIKRTTTLYMSSFQRIMQYEHDFGVAGLSRSDYRELTQSIYNMHSGTMLDVARGAIEFKMDLVEIFGKDAQELAEVRDDFGIIRDIEHSLDQFFTDRLTLRVLLSHIHALSSHSSRNSLGVVTMNTEPLRLLAQAYAAVRGICVRDYGVAPDLLVNGVAHYHLFSGDQASQQKEQQQFAYVQSHLSYIFMELLKNAARASVKRAREEAGLCSEATSDDDNEFCDAPVPLEGRHASLNVPSIQVVVPEVGVKFAHARSVKLTDSGPGMNRNTLQKAFCYFYSSALERPLLASEVREFEKRAPLAGFGFGLPISRVMARYFSGGIDLNSIPGKGTDAYIYL